MTAALPAAVPTATARVGETSNAMTANMATAMPMKIAGKTWPPRNPQPRADRVGEALGDEEDGDHAGRGLRHEGRDRGLAREEDVLGVRAEGVGDEGDQADREPRRGAACPSRRAPHRRPPLQASVKLT